MTDTPHHPQPMPPAPKKSNKTVWIILGIIFGLIILFCGGCLAVGGAIFNEADKAIQQEEANDTPSEVKEGKTFTHDDYAADAGWEVTSDAVDLYTIRNLRITNEADEPRTALLTFRTYQGNDVIGEIECSSAELQPGESSKLDCFSADEFTPDYDTVKVADFW